MFCTKCGKQVAEGALFCTGCGAPLNQETPPTQQYQAPEQQPPQYQPPQYQQQYQQYQYQQQYQQPAGQPYQVPIQRRSIGVCILLSIVTCGIYGIYWFICMVNELNAASGRTTDPSGGTVFLLSLVTCGIYMLYWLFKAGEKVDIIRARRGLPASTSGIIYLILAIFGLSIVSECLIQSELNEVATQ